jgi:HSP20 family protein
MLMRFDPFRDLDRLTQGSWGNGQSTWMPMDAYRRGDQVMVHFDLPGVDPASIEVTVEKNVLTVKAERCWDPRDDDQIMTSERPQGSFTRQLFLGEGLDGDRIEARYNNGVLTLCIPVAEQAKPRKVEITTGENEPRAIESEPAAA